MEIDKLDGLDVEDILENLKKKGKKLNSKKKGNRVELQLAKLLSAHFGKPFTRAIGSGANSTRQIYMPSHARTTLTGDICPPEGFLWVIECKGGYEDKIDLNGILGGCAQLDAFIQQSEDDAGRSGRKPILIWKRSRKPWLALVRECDVDASKFPRRMHYGNRVVVPLEELLAAYDTAYWFGDTK